MKKNIVEKIARIFKGRNNEFANGRYEKFSFTLAVYILRPTDSKASVYNVGDLGLIPGSGRFLEKEMATYSSSLA